MVRAAKWSTTLTQAAVADPDPAPEQFPAPPDYPDGLRCRNVFPGELHYLRSVLGAPPAALGLFAKAKAVAEFLLLFLDPRVRYDYLWWQDPLPGVIQAAATGLHLLDKQLGRPARMLRQRRQKQQWARLVRDLQDRRDPPLPPREPRPVLFLCHGNICRSPFAAAYFNLRLQARGLAGPRALSAGFVRQRDRRAAALLRGLAPAWGVDLGEHLAQPVSRELLAQAGAIFGMDAENYDELLEFADTAGPAFAAAVRSRVYALGALLSPAQSQLSPDACQIRDPYGASPAVSHAVYKQLAAAVDALLDCLPKAR
jgi:protein-tyrosine-phosphatase